MEIIGFLLMAAAVIGLAVENDSLHEQLRQAAETEMHLYIALAVVAGVLLLSLLFGNTSNKS
jgi:hypothetical protein